jgi:hypothetical protein
MAAILLKVGRNSYGKEEYCTTKASKDQVLF